jgi:hypothetical protein
MAERSALPRDAELTESGISIERGAGIITWPVYAAYGFFDLAKAAWAIANPRPSSYEHPVEILWLETKADPSKAAANMPLIEDSLAQLLSLDRKCGDHSYHVVARRWLWKDRALPAQGPKNTAASQSPCGEVTPASARP